MDEPGLCIPRQAQEAFATLERYLRPTRQLVVISGPSGVGKDSVIKRMRELDYPFHFVVTATDRQPRPGEVNGIDYHFMGVSEFERMISDDELFEYAVVYGQKKGIPKAHIREALSSGAHVIMRLDVQGASTVRRKVPDALTIFLAPPSLHVLVDRLRRRAGDAPSQIQERLETALCEMKRVEEFDYVVVNREGRLDDTVKQIVSIISAEECRVARRQITLL